MDIQLKPLLFTHHAQNQHHIDEVKRDVESRENNHYNFVDDLRRGRSISDVVSVAGRKD